MLTQITLSKESTHRHLTLNTELKSTNNQMLTNIHASQTYICIQIQSHRHTHINMHPGKHVITNLYISKHTKARTRIHVHLVIKIHVKLLQAQINTYMH